MNKDWIKIVISSFCKITTGIVLSAYLSLLIFNPHGTLPIYFLGQVLLLAFITSVFGLILHPSQEPSKKMWAFRRIMHLLLIIAFVVGFAYYCGWINDGSRLQTLFIVASVVFLYVVIKVVSYCGDKKKANKMLDGVRRYQQQNTKS